MNERCPVCHLKFEREQGYFLGAMYIGYALSVAPALLLVMLLWQGAHWPYDRAWLCAILVYLPFAPLVARISRVLWIYVDQTIDPERG